MNPQTLLNKPQPQLKITPQITKIGGLVDASSKAAKSSKELRKIFEKGTYQKKIQSSILKRQKKRLEIIQKQNDRNLFKRRPQKVKLPEIKKYAGKFFTPGSLNDPLKAIGALAAFNATSKIANKDYLGAIGPGLVFAGLALGPSLIKGGFNMMRGGAGGGAVSQQASGISGGGLFRGTPYSQTRAGQSYAGMRAERNLPKWAQKAAGGSASRFAASNERVFGGNANLGDRARVLSRRFGFGGVGGLAGNAAARGGTAASARAGGAVAGKAAGIGARAIPLIGTALNLGISAYRFSQGDTVGGILSALSAIPIVGWAALGVDLAREFGAFQGSFLGKNDPLQKQTEAQKQQVEAEKERRGETSGALTFGITLNRYERVVDKFEQLSREFNLTREGEYDEPPMPAPTPVAPGAGYDGPISGDTFFPLPGGDVGTRGNVGPGQAFGAPRDGRTHEGLDMTHWQGPLDAPVAAYKTGKVVAAVHNGYNGYVEIDHGGGLRTLYYHTIPMVSVGETVFGGQQIARLFPAGGNTHLHFGISNGGGYVDPLPHVRAVKNRIPAPLTRQRAEQQHQTSTQGQQNQQPQGLSFALTPQQPNNLGMTIGPGGFNMNGRRLPQNRPTQLREPEVTVPQRSQISEQLMSQGYLPYQQGYSDPQLITVPVPIPQAQQQVVSTGGGGMMVMGGPSEQQLLNSFYRKVLLNTV